MSFWIHYCSSKVLRDDQHPFRRPPREGRWLGAAHGPAKGTQVGHPKLLGTTTQGPARRAVWGPGTPPLFVLRFPCHG